MCVWKGKKKVADDESRGEIWLGLSQSLPEGGGDDEDDEQTEMRSMVGLRGGAQCRLGTHVNLPVGALPWKRARFCGVGLDWHSAAPLQA
jgi:hypothetical protein